MNNSNVDMDAPENEINLGGFPPIFYISNEAKKKKEFKKKLENNESHDNILKLNILNIKNILKEKKT